MLSKSWCVIACLLLALPAGVANASTMGVADFPAGHSLGLGVAGGAYDYGLGPIGIGVTMGGSNIMSTSGHITFGTRMQARFIDLPELKGALIGGVVFDPGDPGSRAYLVPDLGVNMTYRITVLPAFPLNVRLGVSLTVDQGQTGRWAPAAEDDEIPRGNLFQRLTFGPNTNVGIGLSGHERYELTVGGGTLVGLRARF